MVIDTSALLCLLFGEPKAAWVAEQLSNSKTKIIMSQVNVCEALLLAAERRNIPGEILLDEIKKMNIEIVNLHPSEMILVADARRKFPINFGDCFVYALAKSRNLKLLAIDQDFSKVDCEVLLS